MSILQLEEAKFAGTGDRFSASADLEFVIEVAVVSFDGAKGEVELFADLTVRETIGDEVENFEFPISEGVY